MELRGESERSTAAHRLCQILRGFLRSAGALIQPAEPAIRALQIVSQCAGTAVEHCTALHEQRFGLLELRDPRALRLLR